ncbi:MAG TPA: hypothetical protein VIG66_07375 [Noviherbaspirillum sp.]
MDITTSFIKAKRPCASGLRWYLRHYVAGSDYQPLLDDLVAAGRVDDAVWLLEQFGPTNAVLQVDDIEAETIVFAGSLSIKGNVMVDSVLKAGRSISAGGGITAGKSITAGEDVQAGGAIRSGGVLVAGGDIKAGWGIDSQGLMRCGSNLRAGWALGCEQDLWVEGQMEVADEIRVGGRIRCGKGMRAGASISCVGPVHAAHGIESGADVTSESHLEANWGIRAGASIIAGGAIRVGESLQAREEIRAGEGFGVFAGLQVALEAWPMSAEVRAREKPRLLMSGHWAGPCSW